MNGTEIVGEGMLGIEEAMKFSGLGRTILYDMMTKGHLRYSKIGSRRLIPITALKAVLAGGLVGATVAASGTPVHPVPGQQGRRRTRAASRC
jgi:excisionase family DNA binding protein